MEKYPALTDRFFTATRFENQLASALKAWRNGNRDKARDFIRAVDEGDALPIPASITQATARKMDEIEFPIPEGVEIVSPRSAGRAGELAPQIDANGEPVAGAVNLVNEVERAAASGFEDLAAGLETQ